MRSTEGATANSQGAQAPGVKTRITQPQRGDRGQMNDQQDPHDPPPGPATSPIPVLDYGRMEMDDLRFLGQSLPKTVTQLLAVEVFLLLVASVVLDGGVTLLSVAVAIIVAWALIAGLLLRRRIRPRAPVAIQMGIGIALALAAPFCLI
jgi:hypothetical protein